jgi:twitching motility two-component system response regulator PilG/twitching motility two-component system response regulator PilH
MREVKYKGGEMARRKTVLIVDDSQAVVDTLTSVFEEAGYDVASASDGEEVFRKMVASNPDAILLDLYMPKLNGADVCRLVKAHPHWKKTYLVLMSARISDREVEMYRRIGADEVLKKPFDPAVAVALAERAIERASAP